jgi:AbrB family looped-hinge helix DNA binding protein
LRKTTVQVRKKGQVTLPVDLRKALNVDEGSELLFIQTPEGIMVKPVKKIEVREFSGALGEGKGDELAFATTDPELLPLYFKKKYRG